MGGVAYCIGNMYFGNKITTAMLLLCREKHLEYLMGMVDGKMTERELFLEWHFNDWKANNANGDSIDFAKKLYDRVYSHDHTSCVRELEFKAWQAYTQREGFKFVPVDASESMLDAGLNCEHDIDDFVVIDEIYKAMIGAIDE